jgi:O-antigen/teichoic acid export membrane protein
LVETAEASEAAGRLAGSTGILVVRKVAGSLLGAISSVVVVRCLGPADFGQYAAGFAAYYLLLALTEFGFAEVLGRALGRDAPAGRRLGRLLLGLNLVWSVVVALGALVVSACFTMTSIRGGTLLVLAAPLALAGTTTVRQFFYAHHAVGRMATADLVTTLSSTVAVVSLALLGAPAVALAACVSAAAVVNNLLILRAARPWLSGPTGPGPEATTVRSIRSVLREAFPIGFASFLATAYVSIDVVILSGLFPAELIGRYASAVKVLGLLTIFPGLVMSVALPQLSSDWSTPERLDALLARVWHWFMSLVFPALALVAAQATGVMTMLFGPQYGSAGAYLRILTLAGAISMLSQLLGVVVVASARARWLVPQNILALAINVSGNLLIAPRWGIGAAAWLTVLTEVVVCGGSWIILRDRIPYRALLRVSFEPTLAVVLAVAAGWPFSATPWLALPVSAAVYVVGIVLLRGLPVELVRMLLRVAS